MGRAYGPIRSRSTRTSADGRQRHRRSISARHESVRLRESDAMTTDAPRSLDLLDGRWYATQPYEDWTWLREHAPAYWDPVNEVWAITRYDDVLAIEKDPPRVGCASTTKPNSLSGSPAEISVHESPESSER